MNILKELRYNHHFSLFHLQKTKVADWIFSRVIFHTLSLNSSSFYSPQWYLNQTCLSFWTLDSVADYTLLVLQARHVESINELSIVV